jgi:hypothetical protein
VTEEKEVEGSTPFIKKAVKEAGWHLERERLLWLETHFQLPEDLASLVTLIGQVGLAGTLVALGDELLKPKGGPILDFVSSPLSKWLVESTSRLDWAERLRELTPQATGILNKIQAVGEGIAGVGIVDRYPAIAKTVVEVFGKASQLKEPVEEVLNSAVGLIEGLQGFAQRMGEVGTPEHKALFAFGFALFTGVTVSGFFMRRKAAAIFGRRQERFHRRLIAHLKEKRPNVRILSEDV